MAATRGKYNSSWHKEGDRSFQSLAELERYRVLRDRQKKGIIAGLKCQPRFKLYEKDGDKKPFCVYVADFEYFTDNHVVVEDVKGYMAPTSVPARLYKLKRALVRIWLGVHVTEVKKTRHGWTIDGEPEGVVE